MRCDACGHVSEDAGEHCPRCGTARVTTIPVGAPLRTSATTSTSADVAGTVPPVTVAAGPALGPPAPPRPSIDDARAHVALDDPRVRSIDAALAGVSLDDDRALEDEAIRLRLMAANLRAGRAATPRYAGFTIRALAFLIDLFVLGVFTLPLAAAGFFGVRVGMLAIGM